MESLQEIIVEKHIEKHEEWFSRIADSLLTKYLIKTHDNEYQITEIEFYYYSPTHPDKSVYGYMDETRKYNDRLLRQKRAQCKTYTWFFHYSGIDLAFGTKDEPGGILIRAIKDIHTKEDIKGPLVVLLELLNQGVDASGLSSIQLQLKPADNPIAASVHTKQRVGINYGGFENQEYNYAV